jgi:hypothetical protein
VRCWTIQAIVISTESVSQIATNAAICITATS